MFLCEYVARLDELANAAEASGTAPAYLRTWNFYDDVPEPPRRLPRGLALLPRFLQGACPRGSPLSRGSSSPARRKDQAPRRRLAHGRVAHHEGSKSHLRRGVQESNAFADLHDPDLVKFPNFHRAVLLEFDLRAGETVYIPADGRTTLWD